MLRSARPVAFLPTTDRARARRFYEDALGLRFVSDDRYAAVFDLGGLSLRVVSVETLTPQPFAALGWRVEDLEATLDGLAAAGVACERFEGLDQAANGVWTSPSGARIAWFKDPDGNLLSVGTA